LQFRNQSQLPNHFTFHRHPKFYFPGFLRFIQVQHPSSISPKLTSSQIQANKHSATPLTSIPTTRTIRSGKTIITEAKIKTADTITPTNKRLSKPKAKSTPKTPPTTSPIPKPPVPAGGSFELTPLSSLIKQSYTDIALLRRIHTTPSPTLPSPTYAPNTPPTALTRSPKEKEIQQVLIDFDKIEGNLKKFEEMYRQFLRYGGRHGDEAEEVHLVAVVCKFFLPL
jgi:hypothetical protein